MQAASLLWNLLNRADHSPVRSTLSGLTLSSHQTAIPYLHVILLSWPKELLENKTRLFRLCEVQVPNKEPDIEEAEGIRESLEKHPYHFQLVTSRTSEG